MPTNRPPTPILRHLNSTTMEQEAHNSIDMNMLYKAAVLGHWCTVVDAYTSSSGKIIDNYKATGAENDSALHVAVVTANSKTEYISKIIGGIPKDHLLEILRMRNHRGNTPLHLAAATGKVEMCWRIASEDKSLIAERNEQGETPLFLAARRGHEKAFLYLEHHFGKKEITLDNMLMNSSRDTILHSAIYGQHYGLAIRIVEWYPDLVDYANEESLTPLHVLAHQPLSFKSRGTFYLGLFGLIFYHCIIIRRHTWDDQKDMKDIEEIVQSQKSREHPQNYETRYDINNIFKRIFFCIFGHGCSSFAGDRTSLEGGNRRQRRENGPSTTICDLILRILKFIALVPLHFLVSEWLQSIVKRKKKHKLAEQLLNELLRKARSYKLPQEKAPSTSSTSETVINAPPQAETATSTPGKKQVQEQQQQLEQSSEPFARGETPLLTAARLGIVEVVHAILTRFPGAIQDKDPQGKNAVLLAAENRAVSLYRLLEKKITVKESIFSQVDADGNSALHLASRGLRKEGKKWLTTICTAYSVISTLIAAAALATSLNIPGGYNYGRPFQEFESELAFSVFSISSVVALCTSMSALVFFIAILTSQHEQEDFAMKIPNWLLFGLMFLFASIASMLVSFSSSFYFSVRSNLEHAAYPIFAVMCLPVTLFAAAQLPLYLGLNPVKIRHLDQDTDTH